MATAQLPPPILPGPPVAILVPGADTMAAASDPAGVILGWARTLGFDGVSYFAPPAAPIGRAPAGASWTIWTTWSERWERAWLEGRYASADPRLVATTGQSLPCLWDGGMIVARGRLRRFLEDAWREGIRSGVAIPVGTAHGRAVVAFDASVAPVTPARRAAIHERLGELLWAAHAVHANRNVDPPPSPPAAAGARDALSGREQECLAMSARGLTSRDIAAKLGIASRTVDFHVGRAIVKLAALNRHEAIAKAVARGWL